MPVHIDEMESDLTLADAELGLDEERLDELAERLWERLRERFADELRRPPADRRTSVPGAPFTWRGTWPTS